VVADWTAEETVQDLGAPIFAPRCERTFIDIKVGKLTDHWRARQGVHGGFVHSEDHSLGNQMTGGRRRRCQATLSSVSRCHINAVCSLDATRNIMAPFGHRPQALNVQWSTAL
jgi:hypothetical protein